MMTRRDTLRGLAWTAATLTEGGCVAREKSEEDLVSEMRLCVQRGDACVIARDGRIAERLSGRGVRPILEALSRDPNVFRGAFAYDKVVGRAAAAVYIVGAAHRVEADVMSAGARQLLTEKGIVAGAATICARIENREKTGECPMESAVAKLTDPNEMVRALRARIEL